MKLFRVFYLRSVLTECDALRIINPRDIGPPDGILCAVGNHDVSAGCGGIYLPGGRVSIGGAALVDAVEHHSGCHSTGDVNTVKDQGNDSLWVRFRAFPQIHGDLSCRELTAENISARLSDVNHGVGVCLRLRVSIRLCTFSVGNALPL